MKLRFHYVGLLVAIMAIGAADRLLAQYSLRFHGNGVAAPDLDRVKIPVDDPFDVNDEPGPSVDVGAQDFTIEFWMRALASENTAPPQACGSNINWIYGNIILDRDRFNEPRKFGLSIAGGGLIFGVTGEFSDSRTICSGPGVDVTDGIWHHVAVQRRRSDGYMWLFIDGVQRAAADGPDGDVSYPGNEVPTGNYCSGAPCLNSDPFLVIGAEKHDAGPAFPSFSGWVDEIRISNALRYAGTFVPSWIPFRYGAGIVGLYHLDGGSGDLVIDSSLGSGWTSHGTRRFGGAPAGPEWSTDTPFAGGWVLDGYGGLHAAGPPLAVSPATPYLGVDLARDLEMAPGGGVWVLDGRGTVYAGAGAPAPSPMTPYFGFDIAVDLEVATDGIHVLDAFGGLHAGGGAAPVYPATPYFGFDVARDVELVSAGAYVLDGFGGIHVGGGAPLISPATAYFGFDMARDLELASTGYYVLDGFGAVHAGGGAAPMTPATPYFGLDIARDLELVAVGYFVLEGFGGVHAGGGASPLASVPSYFGFDIARDLEFRSEFVTAEQRQTRSEMRRIGTANELMRIDLGRYAQTLTELADEGYLQTVMTDDAWGSPFVYVTGASTFSLVSLGCDGAAGPAPPADWISDPCEPDLIMLDGAFLQAPAGQ